MKIAIPVNDKSADSEICVSFGRTPYFLVHDTETNEAVYIENSAANSQGGAGIKAAQTVADSGADVLITPRCGENAAEVLKAAGIKIFKSDGNSAKANIEASKAGNLTELTEIHSGVHGRGGQ